MHYYIKVLVQPPVNQQLSIERRGLKWKYGGL